MQAYEGQKITWRGWAIVAVLLIASTLLGIALPVQPEIVPAATPDSALYARVEWLEQNAMQVDLETRGPQFDFGAPSVPCYRQPNGEEWVAGDGCVWTILDGATLDIQSGATTNLGGYVTSTLTSLTVNGNALVSDTLTISGTTVAAGGITGNLTGNVTGAISVTAPITVSGYGFTYTTPLTISGVLTNVRLLYYQVP